MNLRSQTSVSFSLQENEDKRTCLRQRDLEDKHDVIMKESDNNMSIHCYVNRSIFGDNKVISFKTWRARGTGKGRLFLQK